jgi:hypothetical protein
LGEALSTTPNGYAHEAIGRKENLMRRTVSRAARLSPSIYLAAIRRMMNTRKRCKTPLSTNRVREERVGSAIGRAVSTESPCHVCGKAAWCLVNTDRKKIICGREGSGTSVHQKHRERKGGA